MIPFVCDACSLRPLPSFLVVGVAPVVSVWLVKVTVGRRVSVMGRRVGWRVQEGVRREERVMWILVEVRVGECDCWPCLVEV